MHYGLRQIQLSISVFPYFRQFSNSIRLLSINDGFVKQYLMSFLFKGFFSFALQPDFLDFHPIVFCKEKCVWCPCYSRDIFLRVYVYPGYILIGTVDSGSVNAICVLLLQIALFVGFSVVINVSGEMDVIFYGNSCMYWTQCDINP